MDGKRFGILQAEGILGFLDPYPRAKASRKTKCSGAASSRKTSSRTIDVVHIESKELAKRGKMRILPQKMRGEALTTPVMLLPLDKREVFTEGLVIIKGNLAPVNAPERDCRRR